MSERIVAIVNPRSNLGATGLRLDALRRELDARLSGASYALMSTERPGHARELAQQAIRDGATYLIACGGDGTISEVVEGMMQSGASERVALSALSRGTGGDFMRSLEAYAKTARPSHLPRARGAARSDAAGAAVNELRLDLARAEFTQKDGARTTRHVLNVASMGMSAEAVRWIDSQGRLGKRHRLSYLLSAFVGLLRYQVAELEVRVDGARLYRGPVQTAAVANGAFFGGGMPVAPDARLDDGLLDVVCIEPAGALSLLPFFFMTFLRGKHIGHPLTHSARAHEVSLSSDREVWLEIDGEPVGTLPVRIEVLPARLRVRVL
jgi:YegS/Rv2252/BmrU family lipid kinase